MGIGDLVSTWVLLILVIYAVRLWVDRRAQRRALEERMRREAQRQRHAANVIEFRRELRYSSSRPAEQAGRASRARAQRPGAQPEHKEAGDGEGS